MLKELKNKYKFDFLLTTDLKIKSNTKQNKLKN